MGLDREGKQEDFQGCGHIMASAFARRREDWGSTRARIIEIAVAVSLTLAALLFVGLAIWATDEYEMRARRSHRGRSSN